MNSVARFDFQADPTPIHGVGGGSGGGEVEDVLRRLGSLETAVSVTKTELTTALPHLATKEDVALVKADIALVKGDVSAIKAQLPHLATKEGVALVKADVAEVKAAVSDAKTSTIQWMVSTMIALAALVFTIAKLVH